MVGFMHPGGRSSRGKSHPRTTAASGVCQTRPVRTVGDLLDALEAIAPASAAFPWDRIGLQIGVREARVERALVSLDSSPAAAAEAAASGCHLLLCHHPLIWDPLKSIGSAHPGPTIRTLIGSGVAFVAAHTNWDAASGGINDVLASRLGLHDVRRFGAGPPARAFKLVTFAPKEEVDALVDALSGAGAGVIGEYERCAFFHDGTGTFRGGQASRPSIGQAGRIENVAETRIEMIVPEDKVRHVEIALRRVHSYEEPAYDFFALRESSGPGMGRIGRLDEGLELGRLCDLVDERLTSRSWTWGDPAKTAETVAVVGGAADGEWRAALEAGADVFLTGEVRQNVAVEAEAAGLAILAAGHYATENPGMEELCRRMALALPEIEWRFYEPPRGSAGRPW